MRSSSFQAVACEKLVLLVILDLALFFFPCCQAQDALHHGRYGSEVQLCGCCLLDLCLLCATTGASGLEVQKTASSPQLQFIAGHRHLFRAADAVLHGPVCAADHNGSSVAVRCQVVDAFIARVVLDMPVVVQRQVHMVQMTSCLSPYSALSLVRLRKHALTPNDVWKKACWGGGMGPRRGLAAVRL